MGLYAGREPWRQKLISSEAQSNIIFLLLEREWKNCWYQLPPWCWCLENAVGRARADVSPWQLLSRAPAEPFWKWMSFQRNLSRQIGFLSAVSNFIKMGAGCKMWLQVWPFVSLEVSNKVKFYLITCRFFMAFLCFHPGPYRSPFLLSCSFRANYHGSLKQSFWIWASGSPSQSPSCVTDTNTCKKKQHVCSPLLPALSFTCFCKLEVEK